VSAQILASGRLRLFGKTTEDVSLSVITKMSQQPAAATVASPNVKTTFQIVDFRAGGTLKYIIATDCNVAVDHARGSGHVCTLETLQPERSCIADHIPFPDSIPIIEEG